MGDKLGIEIPVVPVRGTMWSSKPMAKGYLNNIVFSSESSYFWST
jgi:hypothetical protein